MVFPQLARLTELGLLLLRLMVGVIFITSGWSHLRNPGERGKSIGMSKGFTLFLGAAEMAGSLGVMFGVLTQIAALGLILVMLGALISPVTNISAFSLRSALATVPRTLMVR